MHVSPAGINNGDYFCARFCDVASGLYNAYFRASPRKVHVLFQSREIDHLKQPLRGDQKQRKQIRFTARAHVL